MGNTGGIGGGGGGALQIYAYGAIDIGGGLLANGANGGNGQTLDNHQTGSGGVGGQPASAGSPGDSEAGLYGGTGGSSGSGGTGGAGGDGGYGGIGGNGGGGAGGTLELISSVLLGSGVVSATGGPAGSTNNFGPGPGDGGSGRIADSFNDSDNFAGTQAGTMVAAAQAPPMDVNPYISGSPSAPTIPDLVGGAEAFGLTTLSTSAFAGLVANAPEFTGMALFREHIGPGVYDANFGGYDELFAINAGTIPLSNVKLGAGAAGYLMTLEQGGFANNPVFGGAGAQMLAMLGAGQVYVTLVPSSATNFNVSFQVSGQTFSASVAALTQNTPFYVQDGPIRTNTFVINTLFVGSSGDPGGTLFDALQQAAADTSTADLNLVTFAPGLTGTIQALTDGLSIGDNVNIVGPGAGVLSISGLGRGTLLTVQPGAHALISGLTLTSLVGKTASASGGVIINQGQLVLRNDLISGNQLAPINGGSNGSSGGAIYNNAGILDVDHCTFSGNAAGNGSVGASGASGGPGGAGGNGGAIYNDPNSVATITDSTFVNNSAGAGGAGGTGTAGSGAGGNGGDGGAIANRGVLYLTNDTFTANAAGVGGFGSPTGLTGLGGAIANLPWTNGNISGVGVAYVGNTIIAGNSGGDVAGAFNSLGFNLVGITNPSTGWISTDLTGTSGAPLNPELSALGNYGGLTPTVALLAGSPAIDRGSNALASQAGLATDQRGLPRIFNSTVDIGAFESQPPTFNDVVNGAGLGDTIVLSHDAGGAFIDWTDGPSFGQAIASDPNGLTINGNGGADTILLNYTGGNPLPATLHLNGTFTIDNLQGANPLAGTTLEIGRSAVFISYATSDPITAIEGYLKNGYNNGAWNGTPTASTGAISSLAAQSNPKHNTAIGYADSADGTGINITPNTIELKYTLLGDANLDGQVNSADLQVLLANLNRVGVWDQADFNYDGSVNSADLQALLSTLNTNLGNQVTPQTTVAQTGQNASVGGSPAIVPAVASSPPVLASASAHRSAHPKRRR